MGLTHAKVGAQVPVRATAFRIQFKVTGQFSHGIKAFMDFPDHPCAPQIHGKKLAADAPPVFIGKSGRRKAKRDIVLSVECGTIDATFGYRHSDLREWIQEKTLGRVAAADVVSFSLEMMRQGGVPAVFEELFRLRNGRHAVINSAGYPDMEIFVRGLLQAEAAGKRFLFRTAASFVRVRAGIAHRPLLRGDEVSAGANGGLIVVGSYVKKTTEQLRLALGAPRVHGIEVEVGRFAEPAGREREIARVADEAARALGRKDHALIYTSRDLASSLGVAGELTVAAAVSEGLVAIVRAIQTRPDFIIAKGGITASDLAVRALGVKRALILGQAAAGIPVWRLGRESVHPGLSYVVFPGNVGAAETLRDLIGAFSR